jgi:hypothetical protein
MIQRVVFTCGTECCLRRFLTLELQRVGDFVANGKSDECGDCRCCMAGAKSFFKR